MPEWMTPELCPLWCVASCGSFSSTPTLKFGYFFATCIAVAVPTMPPPITARSYLKLGMGCRPDCGARFYETLEMIRQAESYQLSVVSYQPTLADIAETFQSRRHSRHNAP